MISPVPAPAAAAPGVHGGGVRPAGDHAGEHVGGERRVAERAVGHAHVGDVGHVRPVRRLRLEPAFHEVGPAAHTPRRSGGDGRPAAAHAADSRFPHDVRHPAGSRPCADDRACVLRYPYTAMASVLSRQWRSVSGATPGSLATCSTALVSDEYEPRDSVSSLTAFALNSGVYLVPFAMVPSSPIESGEMRSKNQFISQNRAPE